MARQTRSTAVLGLRVPNKQLSQLQRGAILGLQAHGVGLHATARTLNLPWTTAQSIVHGATREGRTAPKPRPGRPPVTSTRTNRLLCRSARQDRRQPLAELVANVTNNTVSRRTVQRRLSDANIKKWIAAERPRLKPEHAVKRLNWAYLYKDWTVEQWRKVIWSDECWVERSKDPNSVW
ncbi:hypothetical protein H072_11668, partial [Dactylellina haptotyla CBS 200.50]